MGRIFSNMAILNVFKKKEEGQRFEAKQKEKTVKQPSEKSEPRLGRDEAKKSKASKEVSDFAAKKNKKTASSAKTDILVSPHVTEKATDLGKQNAYVFKIAKTANKVMVKQAVNEVYGVRPEKVNITTAKPKKRMVRGRKGIKAGFKKAVIYLKKGDKIEV